MWDLRHHLRSPFVTLAAFVAGAAWALLNAAPPPTPVASESACVETHVHLAPLSTAPVAASGWAQLATGLLSNAAASPTIYLNSEGATVWAGVDDASENRSSVVRAGGLNRAEIPAFEGKRSTWSRVVSCIRARFAPYNVRITDRRPMRERNYHMAVFGGTARAVGRTPAEAARTGGLAPFNGQPIRRSVVFVFTDALGDNVDAICETASMELAHAYGLDHAYNCGDIMSYLPRCGPRRFLDHDVPCGEHRPRPCASGATTQNSHRYLLEQLGAARTASAPRPPGDRLGERSARTEDPAVETLLAALAWRADPSLWAGALGVAAVASVSR